MGSVLTGYTVYYNLRHNSCGHLMQGRFKSIVVEGNNYLLRLSRYIHLNPVHVRTMERTSAAEKVAYLRSYRWSSYREYIGLDPPSGWLEPAPLMALVTGDGTDAAHYSQYVESTINEEDSDFIAEMRRSPIALGDDAFIKQVESHYATLAVSAKRREDVVIRSFRELEGVEAVISDVCGKLGVDEASILRSQRNGTTRGILALSLVRRCGLTQRDVARGLDSLAVLPSVIL